MTYPKGTVIRYRLKLDQKHRVRIPEELLGALNGRLILCTARNGTAESEERGLFVCTPDAWDEVMKPEDPQEPCWSRQQRLMQMNSDFVIPDSQGRFTVPRRCVDALRPEDEITVRFAF